MSQLGADYPAQRQNLSVCMWGEQGAEGVCGGLDDVGEGMKPQASNAGGGEKTFWWHNPHCRCFRGDNLGRVVGILMKLRCV